MVENATEELVLMDINEGVATLTLNHASTINSLSEAMMARLQACFDQLAGDTAVRAIVLRSSGKHFCAGHNLKEMTARRADDDGGKAYFQSLFQTCSTLMKTIVRQPQPIIAEVRGIATAAGCQLVAACDLAVASEDAKFATSGVNIGLFCSTPMVALSRNLTRKQAMEMLLLGEFLGAADVAQMGLINRVVPEEGLASAAMQMAQMIAQKSPVAIKMGKKAFYEQLGMSLDDAYEHAGAVMADNMMACDAQGGIGAFIAKQPMPEWIGS